MKHRRPAGNGGRKAATAPISRSGFTGDQDRGIRGRRFPDLPQKFGKLRALTDEHVFDFRHCASA